jgi:hypothetical protein
MKKNRDSICMLGWSCSNKTSIAACHVLDPIDHVLDPIAIARPPGPGAGRRPYVQPSAHRHRPRHTTHVDVATPPVRAAPMPMPMHAHADGRRCARSSLCADPSVCQRSRRLSQRLLFRFRRALSAVSGGAVRCVLQCSLQGYSCLLPAACAWLGGAARRPRPRLPASVLDSLIRLRRCALVVACECNAAARRCGALISIGGFRLELRRGRGLAAA